MDQESCGNVQEYLFLWEFSFFWPVLGSADILHPIPSRLLEVILTVYSHASVFYSSLWSLSLSFPTFLVCRACILFSFVSHWMFAYPPWHIRISLWVKLFDICFCIYWGLLLLMYYYNVIILLLFVFAIFAIDFVFVLFNNDSLLGLCLMTVSCACSFVCLKW